MMMMGLSRGGEERSSNELIILISRIRRRDRSRRKSTERSPTINLPPSFVPFHLLGELDRFLSRC